MPTAAARRSAANARTPYTHDYSATMTIRCSPEQRDAVFAAAKRAGMPVSVWLRVRIIQTLKDETP